MVAQWLEQSAHNRLVGGSNPSRPTLCMKKSKRKYTAKKYEHLFFAVTQGENEDYKRMYNLMVDFGLTKQQIFKRFTEYLETYRHEADMILKKI